MANAGAIAHHGYQRPHLQGWQTASCMGALHLPYEADRTQLGIMLASLRDMRDRTEWHAVEVEKETTPAVFTYDLYIAGRYKSHYLNVTRDTFTALKTTHAIHFTRRSCYKFEDVQQRHISELRHRVKMVTIDIDTAQRRFDAWKLTHRFDGTAWEKLP